MTAINNLQQENGENPNNYAWESAFKMSWDALSIQNGILSKPKPTLSREYSKLQRGLIRNLVIVVDASRVMGDTDYQAAQGGGNRLGVVLGSLKTWSVSLKGLFRNCFMILIHWDQFFYWECAMGLQRDGPPGYQIL
jgi:hypothetical protein